MGKRDILTKQYLSQNAIFADAFNFYLFNGEKVIKPEDLQERDVNELAVTEKLGNVLATQKMRDVLKVCSIKQNDFATLVLLGIEGQASVHYAMPVRNYLYDALNYSEQVENIRKLHKERRDLEGAELLSGFSKNDHVLPVITLCICFDRKKWDGPRKLSEMFGVFDPRIKDYVNDYRLNLITPDEIDNFEKFASELGLLLEFIHNSDDMKTLRDIMNSRKEYQSVDVNTVNMINTYTKANIRIDNEVGGEINMCKAIQDMVEEGRNEGADMLASLLQRLEPNTDDYKLAINGTAEDRQKLFAKYNITR